MPEAGSVQKLGETCSEELRLTLMLVAIAIGGEAELCRARAVDIGVEGRRIDLLLEMRVGNARNGGDAVAELVGNGKIGRPVIADGPHVDLRRQAEIQDLGDDVGRLEIEDDLGEGVGKHLAQLAHVVGGRRVALLQRHHDHTVVGADGRAVGEGQVIGACRQADIVDDELPLVLGDHLSDLVLDRLEDALGGLDARSGRRADMELNLPAVDQRKEVAADKHEHHAAKTKHEHRRRSGR